MANQDVKVSVLNSVSTLSTDDLSLETVVDELSATGYTSKKIKEGAKASQYLEAFTFANLNTTAKTIVGAINEAATTGGADEFIIHMTDTTVTETATDIIDAFDNGSEIWLESQITGEAVKARLPLLAYISDSSQLVLRFSGITYANNKYRYCDVQMLRSPEQIVGRQAINVTFAVIDDATTSASSVWSSQKTAGELAGKAEIDDDAVSSSTAWSSEQIVSLLPTESASGAVANFETPLTLPLVSHTVTIEPVQAGTGDPSPSNPRAISGWSAVAISHSGADTSDPTTYTRTFLDSNDDPVTVYGGSENLKTGEGTAIHGIVDLSTVNWYKSTSLTGIFYTEHLSEFVAKDAYSSDFVCSIAKAVNKDYTSLSVGEACMRRGLQALNRYSLAIRVDDATYPDVTDLVNALTSDAKTTFYLATPQTFHTDPLNLDTLKGVNNIWADTGDTAVEFKQDIQTYIDNRLSSGTRSLSLAKVPIETEETKQEEQEGDEDVNR